MAWFDVAPVSQMILDVTAPALKQDAVTVHKTDLLNGAPPLATLKNGAKPPSNKSIMASADNGSKANEATRVFIKVDFVKISDIDTKSQKFIAEIAVRQSWTHPSVANMTPLVCQISEHISKSSSFYFASGAFFWEKNLSKKELFNILLILLSRKDAQIGKFYTKKKTIFFWIYGTNGLLLFDRKITWKTANYERIFNGEKWSGLFLIIMFGMQEFAQLPQDQRWDPKLYISNLEDKKSDEVLWSLDVSSGTPTVYLFRRLKGTFFENMELMDFPNDIQVLNQSECRLQAFSKTQQVPQSKKIMTKYPNPKYSSPKYPNPKYPKSQNTQAQNTQGQNTQSPKIPKIEIAILIK